MKVPALNESSLPQIVQAIRQLCLGSTNALGTCTLAASATQTVVTNPNVGLSTRIFLSPLSANAGAAPWYVKAVADGSFTIGHDSTAATDRTFAYELRSP